MLGDTYVTVRGAHLRNGHAPYCRFPQSGGGYLAVNASRHDGGDALVCRSPAASP